MTSAYEETGRTDQKTRTRAALIGATRELLACGRIPTVEEAAAAARTSRATAYRYFPSQRALLVAAHPEIERESLLGPDPPVDLERRLDLVVDEIMRVTLETEPQRRATLRLSLEAGPAAPDGRTLRSGRRIVWVRDALSPLDGEVPDAELRRLIHAVAASVGIDTLVWMVDVAGLSREEAVAMMRWSARALLHSALEERRTGEGGRGGGSKRLPGRRGRQSRSD